MTARLLVPEARELEGRAALEAVYLPPRDRHVRLNFVASLDGAVDSGGTSAGLGGPADREAFAAMRAVADVVLAGAATVRDENYGPARVSIDARARRVARGQKPVPPVAVVTASGRLDLSGRLFTEPTDGPRPIIVTTAEGRRPEMDAVADVIACGGGRVDLDGAIAHLGAMGLGRVLCEGGPVLAAALLSVGLVDELCLTLSPLLAGPGGRRLSELWSGPPTRLRLESLIEGGGMLMTRYSLVG